MKTIVVNAKNISEFHPYQGTTKAVKIGDVLTVINEKIPSVRRDRVFFGIVTDYQPSDNTQRMISRKDDMMHLYEDWIKDNKNTWLFNRYSINQKFIK